ncbi:uncharacterized protein LOC135391046 [Ornithodoros turicata]|uniref:uncharacterized protein LOC135391046 n=1 Tax=Ornithodoros turicata TaxID=34597 RepID=UPI00313994FA
MIKGLHPVICLHARALACAEPNVSSKQRYTFVWFARVSELGEQHACQTRVERNCRRRRHAMLYFDISLPLFSLVFCVGAHRPPARPFENVTFYGHLKVRHGNSFVVVCFTDLATEIFWTKDGRPLKLAVPPGYSMSQYLEDMTWMVSALEVRSAQAVHSGAYSCTNASIVTHRVTVIEQYDSALGTETIDCVHVIPNTSLELTCGVPHKHDRTEVSWLKDGQLLTSGDRTMVVNSSLVIRRATEADSGRYSCLWNTSSGVGNSHGVRRYVLVTPIQLYPFAHSHQAHVGERVSILCMAKAFPKPRVAWYFGGQQADGNISLDAVELSEPRYEEGQSLLTLANIQPSNIGTYTCVASHKHCDNVAAIKSLHLYASKGEMVTNEEYPGVGITLDPNAGSLRLYCHYPAVPQAKIRWLKDDKDVEEYENKDKYTKDAENQSLVIDHPTEGDVGNYTCIASGVNKTAVILVGLKAKVMKDATPVSAHMEGKRVYMSCKVAGIPTPYVRWFRNNKLIKVSRLERLRYKEAAGVFPGTLEIHGLTREDSGTYSCVADNGHSRELQQFHVEVKTKADAILPVLVILVEVVALCVLVFNLHAQYLEKFKRRPAHDVTWQDLESAPEKEQEQGSNADNEVSNAEDVTSAVLTEIAEIEAALLSMPPVEACTDAGVVCDGDLAADQPQLKEGSKSVMDQKDEPGIERAGSIAALDSEAQNETITITETGVMMSVSELDQGFVEELTVEFTVEEMTVGLAEDELAFPTADMAEYGSSIVGKVEREVSNERMIEVTDDELPSVPQHVEHTAASVFTKMLNKRGSKGIDVTLPETAPAAVKVADDELPSVPRHVGHTAASVFTKMPDKLCSKGMDVTLPETAPAAVKVADDELPSVPQHVEHTAASVFTKMPDKRGSKGMDVTLPETAPAAVKVAGIGKQKLALEKVSMNDGKDEESKPSSAAISKTQEVAVGNTKKSHSVHALGKMASKATDKQQENVLVHDGDRQDSADAASTVKKHVLEEPKRASTTCTSAVCKVATPAADVSGTKRELEHKQTSEAKQTTEKCLRAARESVFELPATLRVRRKSALSTSKEQVPDSTTIDLSRISSLEVVMEETAEKEESELRVKGKKKRETAAMKEIVGKRGEKETESGKEKFTTAVKETVDETGGKEKEKESGEARPDVAAVKKQRHVTSEERSKEVEESSLQKLGESSGKSSPPLERKIPQTTAPCERGRMPGLDESPSKKTDVTTKHVEWGVKPKKEMGLSIEQVPEDIEQETAKRMARKTAIEGRGKDASGTPEIRLLEDLQEATQETSVPKEKAPKATHLKRPCGETGLGDRLPTAVSAKHTKGGAEVEEEKLQEGKQETSVPKEKAPKGTQLKRPYGKTGLSDRLSTAVSARDTKGHAEEEDEEIQKHEVEVNMLRTPLKDSGRATKTDKIKHLHETFEELQRVEKATQADTLPRLSTRLTSEQAALPKLHEKDAHQKDTKSAGRVLKKGKERGKYRVEEELHDDAFEKKTADVSTETLISLLNVSEVSEGTQYEPQRDSTPTLTAFGGVTPRLLSLEPTLGRAKDSVQGSQKETKKEKVTHEKPKDRKGKGGLGTARGKLVSEVTDRSEKRKEEGHQDKHKSGSLSEALKNVGALLRKSAKQKPEEKHASVSSSVEGGSSESESPPVEPLPSKTSFDTEHRESKASPSTESFDAQTALVEWKTSSSDASKRLSGTLTVQFFESGIAHSTKVAPSTSSTGESSVKKARSRKRRRRRRSKKSPKSGTTTPKVASGRHDSDKLEPQGKTRPRANFPRAKTHEGTSAQPAEPSAEISSCASIVPHVELRKGTKTSPTDTMSMTAEYLEHPVTSSSGSDQKDHNKHVSTESKRVKKERPTPGGDTPRGKDILVEYVEQLVSSSSEESEIDEAHHELAPCNGKSTKTEQSGTDSTSMATLVRSMELIVTLSRDEGGKGNESIPIKNRTAKEGAQKKGSLVEYVEPPISSSTQQSEIDHKAHREWLPDKGKSTKTEQSGADLVSSTSMATLVDSMELIVTLSHDEGRRDHEGNESIPIKEGAQKREDVTRKSDSLIQYVEKPASLSTEAHREWLPDEGKSTKTEQSGADLVSSTSMTTLVDSMELIVTLSRDEGRRDHEGNESIPVKNGTAKEGAQKKVEPPVSSSTERSEIDHKPHRKLATGNGKSTKTEQSRADLVSSTSMATLVDSMELIVTLSRDEGRRDHEGNESIPVKNGTAKEGAQKKVEPPVSSSTERSEIDHKPHRKLATGNGKSTKTEQSRADLVSSTSMATLVDSMELIVTLSRDEGRRDHEGNESIPVKNGTAKEGAQKKVEPPVSSSTERSEIDHKPHRKLATGNGKSTKTEQSRADLVSSTSMATLVDSMELIVTLSRDEGRRDHESNESIPIKEGAQKREDVTQKSDRLVEYVEKPASSSTEAHREWLPDEGKSTKTEQSSVDLVSSTSMATLVESMELIVSLSRDEGGKDHEANEPIKEGAQKKDDATLRKKSDSLVECVEQPVSLSSDPSASDHKVHAHE